MKIETSHITAMKQAMTSSDEARETLYPVYHDMVLSIRPKISDKMMAAFEHSVLAGQTYEAAANDLKITKVAVGQHTVRCLGRLIEYEQVMGRQIPQELMDGKVTTPSAAKHLDFFKEAHRNFINMD
ncbi:hypothetical protein KI655_18610 [Vibrio sp. D404a]|uniref:hypothetical protein n=1 Tax=unclassified Vibrio TaxID=2614977 RepID=UPI0025558990|nr:MULTISPECIES: hypothetical protein [unclassified Vibrio]MDK9739311.1 hypothetical protein [Vibrio sp. D404a]MDK9797653.1 hypothetical protein [Vibrio sp. D449a]